jgi:hypothetical protein
MNKILKYILSIWITVFITAWAVFAWNWLTASDWDTLDFTKWNELVEKVTKNWIINTLVIVDETQVWNLNPQAPLASLHIRAKVNEAAIYTAWSPKDITYPIGENFQVWEWDGTTFLERFRISWNTWNIWIWTSSPQEKLVVASDYDADFDLSTSHAAQSSSFHIRRSHGTIDSPSVPVNTGWNWNQIWKIEAEVFDWSSYKDGAAIGFVLDSEPSVWDIPTNMFFSTTPDWSSWLQTRMFISQNWNIWVGTSSPSTKLHVAGTITEDSDLRLKENITQINNSLEKVLQLKWVIYNWKDTAKYNDKINMWVIAQDVEKVFPEVINTDINWYKSVEYSKLIAPLIEAIKEQQIQINELKEQINK